MDRQIYARYVFFGLFFVSLGLAYFVFKPFIRVILTALVLAYLFNPLYAFLQKRIGNQFLSSLITVLFIFLIITVAFVFILNTLISQFGTLHIMSMIGDAQSLKCDRLGMLCPYVERMLETFPTTVSDSMGYLVQEITMGLFSTVKSITSGIIGFFFVLLMVFFLLLDSSKLIAFIHTALPLKQEHEARLMKTFNDTVHAVVYGDIITSLIQGLVAWLGYWLIGGFENPLVLGLLTSLFAIIPFMGTGFVWVPASAYLVVSGLFMNAPGGLFRGIGLFLYGLILISTIDNLIRPHIIGKRAKMHPILVLIGVLGGIEFLGVIGVIAGPVILASALTLMQIFEEGT
jgi:predicted PurR-regulated permease PerM